QGNRLGPDERDKAVEWKYERPLRDYAYLFAATSRQLVELRAQRDSLREDVRKLGEALEISKKFVAMRTEEQAGLTADLAHMQKDQEAIAAHLATIQRLLQNVERTITETQAENERMAQELRQRQVQALENADQAAPGPRAEFTGVR
ncbi:MAG TPA: hypothetical protein VEQ85_12090, partial [Lacipirellulaceae bacterium]|nr:hypothetical protein [Lacipirellulaceae bacterium]